MSDNGLSWLAREILAALPVSNRIGTTVPDLAHDCFVNPMLGPATPAPIKKRRRLIGATIKRLDRYLRQELGEPGLLHITDPKGAAGEKRTYALTPKAAAWVRENL